MEDNQCMFLSIMAVVVVIIVSFDVVYLDQLTIINSDIHGCHNTSHFKKVC